MSRLKWIACTAVLGGLLAASAAGTTWAAHRHHAGDCGEFKYWHHGQCVDAREKAGGAWTRAVY